MPADPAPLTSGERDALYRTLIQPVIFDGIPGAQPETTLVLLGGQAGAGKTRNTRKLLGEHSGMAALTGDDLRIFHPDYRTVITAHPETAGVLLAEATQGWVRSAIDHALHTRRSLLLEGSFGDPEVALATAAQFRRAGFHVRIVAIASPRVLSIVSAASRYLRSQKTGNPARFTRLTAHDRGYHGTAALIDTVTADPTVDRITVISRDGTVLFDGSRDQEPLSGANTALHDGRHPVSWGARSTMELLGELKQITGYATVSGDLTAHLAELLDAAHEEALAEVVPNLSVDADSPQARFIQQAVTEQLVTLRRNRSELEPGVSLAQQPEVAVTGPSSAEGPSSLTAP